MQNSSVSLHFVPEQYRVISGSVLKLVAVITMFIDHIGAGILLPMYQEAFYPFGLTQRGAYILYRVTRNIGRIAFPLFCFLMVESLIYTTNRLRYFLVQLLFALLSEFPYDITLNCVSPGSQTLSLTESLRFNRAEVLGGQNVFLTLSIGFLCIWGMQFLTERVQHLVEASGRTRGQSMALPLYMLSALLSFLLICATCLLADMIGVDYGHRGILVIVIFYLLRRFPPLALITAYVYLGVIAYAEGRIDLSVWSTSVWAFPGYLLMLFYSGKRGFIRGNIKYAFYAFYPVHLLLIWMVRRAIYA
ncbi:MAG: hypothetical protein IJP92_04995 [Lachnospiraceae bacterium]|nr:hypothetical protein [Lachnospiraceae bacterium]